MKNPIIKHYHDNRKFELIQFDENTKIEYKKQFIIINNYFKSTLGTLISFDKEKKIVSFTYGPNNKLIEKFPMCFCYEIINFDEQLTTVPYMLDNKIINIEYQQHLLSRELFQRYGQVNTPMLSDEKSIYFDIDLNQNSDNELYQNNQKYRITLSKIE